MSEYHFTWKGFKKLGFFFLLFGLISYLLMCHYNPIKDEASYKTIVHQAK